jgi:hypothetical protein
MPRPRSEHRAVLALRERVLGPRSMPDVFLSCFNLAHCAWRRRPSMQRGAGLHAARAGWALNSSLGARHPLHPVGGRKSTAAPRGGDSQIISPLCRPCSLPCKSISRPRLVLASIRTRMSAVTFLKELRHNWKTIGAVAPSSPALAERMMEAAGVWQARRILELGPGTGAFTSERLPTQCRMAADYVGVELNDTFVQQLRPRVSRACALSVPVRSEFDFSQVLPPWGEPSMHDRQRPAMDGLSARLCRRRF